MTITDEEFMREAQSLIDQPWKWVKGSGSRYIFDPDGNQTIGRCMRGALEAISREHGGWYQGSQYERVYQALIDVIYEETEVATVPHFNDHYATHDQVMAVMEKAAAKLAEHVDS